MTSGTDGQITTLNFAKSAKFRMGHPAQVSSQNARGTWGTKLRSG